MKLYPDSPHSTGAVLPWTKTTAPTAWRLCDGSAVSRSEFRRLFGRIGTTFGSGDGSTTFNLPDLRGRVPLGKDDMGGSSANRVTASQADNIGQGSGAESHTLATSEMPSHSHLAGVSVDSGTALGQTKKSTGTDGLTSSSAGSGGAHNNMQPYQSYAWIVKI